MHRVLPIIAAVALIAAFELPARGADESSGSAVGNAAEATGSAIKNGAEATGHAIKSGAEATGHAIKEGVEATGNVLGITESDRERYEANERGEHRVTGTVAAVDRDSGAVDLATEHATYQLHFPPEALKSVAKNDRLTVAMAFAPQDKEKPAQEAKRGYKAGDEPMNGDHWMTGTVSEVDTANGMVDVQTDERPLKVQFARDAVRDLKPGEKIALELSFEPAASTAH